MLFKRAEVTSAYLKMGILGFAGAGKSFTATSISIGLIECLRELKIAEGDRPMFWLDTETGSDWLKPRIEAAGIELHTAKTRSFADLLTAVPEAERNASILIVDSITHFWTEICDSYMKRKNRTRLQFEDWAYLKKEWRKFTDLFINAPVHIILCGRAGYEYDYFENDAGKKELAKTGVKMKAESEMGYEPSLLVLMERETDMETMKVHHIARVLKDRSDLIDGKEFREPGFGSFMPHIKFLNLGGQQLGVDTTRNSNHIIPKDAPRDNNRIKRQIVLEEIEAILVKHYPGQTAADKKAKADLIEKHFATRSWTEISELRDIFDLKASYNSLHEELEGKPCRYLEPAKSIDDLNDEIPHNENVLKAG